MSAWQCWHEHTHVLGKLCVEYDSKCEWMVKQSCPKMFCNITMIGKEGPPVSCLPPPPPPASRCLRANRGVRFGIGDIFWQKKRSSPWSMPHLAVIDTFWAKARLWVRFPPEAEVIGALTPCCHVGDSWRWSALSPVNIGVTPVPATSLRQPPRLLTAKKPVF